MKADMHEMGIANSILEAVRNEARRYPDAHPTKVGVRVGELAAIDPEALSFCFEVLARDTDLDGLRLEIEVCPRRHRCRQCRSEFTVSNYDFECPECHSMVSDCISGDELQLAYLEVEDREPSTAGTKSSK